MIVQMVKIGSNLKVLDGDKPRLQEFKQSLAEGQVVNVEFQREPKSASTQQSKYFHLLRDAYSRAMGYDKLRAKEELCALWGVSVTYGQAMEDPPRWSGYVVKIWDRTLFRKSTREYSRDEWSALIEGTLEACFENGIDIQQILDDYREAMKHANTAT